MPGCPPLWIRTTNNMWFYVEQLRFPHLTASLSIPEVSIARDSEIRASLQLIIISNKKAGDREASLSGLVWAGKE